MKSANVSWILSGILCLALGPYPARGQSLEDNFKAGIKALSQKRFTDAEKLLGAALKEAEAQKREDRTVQLILASLAGVNYYQDKYEEAERYYQRVLSLMEKSTEIDIELMMMSSNGLGIAHLLQKKYAQAEQVFKKAVEAGEKYGKDLPEDVGRALDGLAVAYLAQRKYEEAEPIYKRAVAHYEKAFGEADETVARAVENYAGLLWRMRRDSEAENLEARAKAIRSKRAK